MGDWRESLGADAVARFEAVAATLMDQLGYERSSVASESVRAAG